MGKSLTRVLRRFYEKPWAMLESELDSMHAIVQARIAGVDLSADEKQAVQRMAAARTKIRQEGAVGVLPLYGPIAGRMNLFTEISGGTSMELWMQAFRQLRDDPQVTGILVDGDTPGGEVALVPEAAAEILAARSEKRIVFIARTMLASAGYWLASAADEIVVTPSGEVGSIGVVLMHSDYSQQNEMMGVKPTYITYGEHKAEGHPDAPLSDDTRAYLQGLVNSVGDQFVRAVATGRRVSMATVKSDFGQGRMFLAEDAVKRGLADRVATFEETLARMMKQPAKGSRSRAAMAAVSAGVGTMLADDEMVVPLTAEQSQNLSDSLLTGPEWVQLVTDMNAAIAPEAEPEAIDPAQLAADLEAQRQADIDYTTTRLALD